MKRVAIGLGPASTFDREALEKTLAAQSTANKTAGGGKGKSGKVSSKSLLKRHDSRNGVLTGMILWVGVATGKKKGSSDGGGGADGSAGSMASKGPAGGGGSRATHNLIVAIVDLGNVDTDSYGADLKILQRNDNDNNDDDDDGGVSETVVFEPLFRRDFQGRLHLGYSLVDENPGLIRGKTWAVDPLGEKFEYSIQNGDCCWASIWQNPGYAVGDMVKIVMKLNQKINVVSDIVLPGRNEFSDYYLCCDVSPIDPSLDSYRGYPVHTKLRSLWPLQLQNFPSAKEVAAQICEKADSREDYRPKVVEGRIAAVQREMSLSSGEVGLSLPHHPAAPQPNREWKEPASGPATSLVPPASKSDPGLHPDVVRAVLETYPTRKTYKRDLTPVYLLCVDATSSVLPCCDDYDPTLVNAIRSKSTSEAVARNGEDDASFGGGMLAEVENEKEEGEAVYDLTKCGYCATVSQWPDCSEMDRVHVKPKEAEFQEYFALELWISIISWGYPGCHYDADYVHPLGSDSDYNLETGLVTFRSLDPFEETAKDKSHYVYQFKRTQVRLRLSQSHVPLGPTDIKELAELIVSHPVPFDALVETQEGDGQIKGCKDLEQVTAALLDHSRRKKSGLTFDGPSMRGRPGTTDFNEHNNDAMQRAAFEERGRWDSVDERTAKDMMSNPKDHAVSPSKDGILMYKPKMVAWRMCEYLVNVGGISITLKQAEAAKKRVKEAKSASGRRESIVNPVASINDEGFVYLNGLEVAPSRLGPEYKFYALVCYGGNLGNTLPIQTSNREEMEKMIASSKSLPRSPKAEEEIEAYLVRLQKSGVSIFYYAVDSTVIPRCQALAKKRRAFMTARYGRLGVSSDNAAAVGGVDSSNGTTTTTTTTITTTTTGVANRSEGEGAKEGGEGEEEERTQEFEEGEEEKKEDPAPSSQFHPAFLDSPDRETEDREERFRDSNNSEISSFDRTFNRGGSPFDRSKTEANQAPSREKNNKRKPEGQKTRPDHHGKRKK
jgi:hypothetical protein